MFGFRHLQTFLLFCAIATAYALRVNLSVAIVVMTDANDASSGYEDYAWNEKTKGLIFSSFFFGYVLTQVPSGYLARRIGGKTVINISLFSCSVLAILTPLCARLGDWPLVLASRILQGILQGGLFPAAHTIISRWSPVNERGLISAIAYSGCQFGTCVMLASSGVIVDSSLGWPGIFYISGGFGILWSIIYTFVGSSSPSDCKSLSEKERDLIESHLGPPVEQERRYSMNPPWAQFFKSRPVWALIIVHCTNNWGLWTLVAYIPLYIKNVLNMDIKKNALSSALPYFTMWVLGFMFTALAEVLHKKECITVKTSRMLFNSIGHGTPAVTLIALGYVDASQAVWAVVLLTITVSIASAAYLGYQINHIDLSPNFAGVLMGISNCLANITGILAPLAVALIVTNEKSLFQWRIVFFLASAFYFVGNLIFVIYGDVSVQPWNDPKD